MSFTEPKVKEVTPPPPDSSNNSNVPSGFILKLFQMVNGAPDEVISVSSFLLSKKRRIIGRQKDRRRFEIQRWAYPWQYETLCSSKDLFEEVAVEAVTSRPVVAPIPSALPPWLLAKNKHSSIAFDPLPLNFGRSEEEKSKRQVSSRASYYLLLVL